jgi:hypothetical protein
MWSNQKGYKKMKKLLIILFFLTSCSVMPRVSHKKKGINPEFKPYVESYRAIIGKDNYKKSFEKLSLNFAELKDGVVGRCWWLMNGGYEVEIDTNFWYNNMFDPMIKEFLIYHELEHCIRYRMHTNKPYKINNLDDFWSTIGYYLGIMGRKGYLKDGCPASIMHSHTMSWKCRPRHYIYYIKEIMDYDDSHLYRFK